MLLKIKCWALTALCCMAASCNNYLDRMPLDGPSDVSFLANESELMMTIDGCYRSLLYHPSDREPLVLLLDNSTDISWDRNNSAMQQTGKGSHDSNNSYIKSIWTEAYKGIARCNFLLDNIDRVKDKVSPEVYAQVKAEARFLRAYTYHYLIELFGGVPLVTKTLSIADAQVPGSTKEAVADFVITEMEEAAKDLPVNNTNGTGKASKGAALAIIAKTALYNERWDKAAEAAKSVMDLQHYSLHPSFGELFTYNGQQSKEIILSIQYMKSISLAHLTPYNFLSRNAQGSASKVPGQALIDSYECTDGMTIDKSPHFDPAKPFENRDPRLGLTVALPGSIYFNYQFETNKDSVKCWNYNTTPATRVDNQDALNAYASYTGYCWRKYIDLADKPDLSNSEINIILIRYAEVLLTYAEAKIEANKIDNTVYNAINEVRQRPGVDMPAITPGKTQAELRSIVRRERKCELAGEGQRLFDIRRWKIADKVMNGFFYGRVPNGLLAAAPAIDDNGTPDYEHVPNKADMRVIEQRIFNPQRDYLWPIPSIEILTNKALVQNPNY